MPTALLQATTVELVDELLRRGIGLDEVCHLVGKDAVDRWAALNAYRNPTASARHSPRMWRADS
jgi:hypothetical protein